MFMYVIFAPLLVALVCGTFLHIWSHTKHSVLGKFVGGFVAILSILLLILQAWQLSKTWQDGRLIKKEMQKMMRQMPETTTEKKTD